MVNVVVPMAGRGSRFAAAGYGVPKPFIDVLGKPMIEQVLDNIDIAGARFFLIAQESHLLNFASVFGRLGRTYEMMVLPINFITQGAACTVLLAASAINSETPLLLVNSDQLVDVSLAEYVEDCERRHLDGSILTFYSEHPKWSYVRTSAAGLVEEVKEKQPISNQATVGIYYFSRGSDFVSASAEMLARNERTRDEFYVAPVYNYLIRDGKRVGVYEIAEEAMHGLGTPEDLEIYVSRQRMKVGSWTRGSDEAL